MEEQLGITRKTVEIRAEKIIKLLYDSMFYLKNVYSSLALEKKGWYMKEVGIWGSTVMVIKDRKKASI